MTLPAHVKYLIIGAGVHGLSIDSEGNFYTAEVDSGRVQKFRPKPGANPAQLVSKPVYSAWK